MALCQAVDIDALSEPVCLILDVSHCVLCAEQGVVTIFDLVSRVGGWAVGAVSL